MGDECDYEDYGMTQRISPFLETEMQAEVY